MQKVAPHTIPPQRARETISQDMQTMPPALLLARRIRREQGIEQVKQFLAAMEPFLAPYERSSIAGQMGVKIPISEPQERHRPQNNNQQRPQQPVHEPAQQSAVPNAANQGFATGGMNSGSSPMQMLQLIGQLANMQNGMNPALMQQLLGGMGR